MKTYDFVTSTHIHTHTHTNIHNTLYFVTCWLLIMSLPLKPNAKLTSVMKNVSILRQLSMAVHHFI